VVRVEGDRLGELLEEARQQAEVQVPAIVNEARRQVTAQLQGEITRLRELKKVNPTVRQEEIDLLAAQRRDLEEHLSNARIRLDALRVGDVL
jgi:ATP-dependent helicase HepA